MAAGASAAARPPSVYAAVPAGVAPLPRPGRARPRTSAAVPRAGELPLLERGEKEEGKSERRERR